MNRVFWNRDVQPEGLSIDQVLYHVRLCDHGDNLLLDAVCMDDIMADADGVIALDAMVLPVNLLTRKMDVLQAIMARAGGAVTPVSVQISAPFKQRGVTNVAVLFELSDGQSVSIYFHNPDATPNTLASTDELISWKWLLNKKDITIVVAPERGEDLNPREVARRIMRLAEKNSAAFQRVNARRAERMGAIQSLKTEIADLEIELVQAQRALEAEQILAEDRLANPVLPTPAVAPVIDPPDEREVPAVPAFKLADAMPAFTAWLAENAPAVAMVEAIDAAAASQGGSVLWGGELSATMDAAQADIAEDDHDEDFDEDAEWAAMPEEDDEHAVLDGDFAGHPFRGNQYRRGSRTSGTAVAASIHARKLSRHGSEREVHTAHRIAHHAHVAASLAVTTRAARRYHRKLARLHARHAGVAVALDAVARLDGISDMHATALLRNKDSEEVGLVLIYQDGSAGIRDAAGNRVTPVSENVAAAVDGVKALLQGKATAIAGNGVAMNAAEARRIAFSLMGRSQQRAVEAGLNGEERDYFLDLLNTLATTYASMPRIGAQDGKGGDAVAYLHYFSGGMDWYVTERGDTTEQCFGLADLYGDGGELGYMSIDEFTSVSRVELDFHWTPKTIAQIRGKDENGSATPQADAWEHPLASPESLLELAQQRGITARVYESAPYASGTAALRADLRKGGVAMAVVWNADQKQYDLHRIEDGQEAQPAIKTAPLSELLDEFVALARTASDAGADAPRATAIAGSTVEPVAHGNERASDQALFQSVIDGTVADILAPSLADALEAAFLRHEGDAEMAGLFEQAVNAYQAAMLTATASL